MFHHERKFNSKFFASGRCWIKFFTLTITDLPRPPLSKLPLIRQANMRALYFAFLPLIALHASGHSPLMYTLRVCAVLFLLLFFEKSVITWEQTRNFSPLHGSLIADRKATARTAMSLSHPAYRQKKHLSSACFRPSFHDIWFSGSHRTFRPVV